MKIVCLVVVLLCISPTVSGQVDQSQTGAWYMYFYNASFKDSQWGIQGDFQYRDWAGLGDMEQLLLRSGLTFRPKTANVLFTLGFANITSGVPGDSNDTSSENRIYQEALLPHTMGGRVYLTHRFRYEQRFVENQDFRTRYRYMLFFNVPLNKTSLEKNALYLALYNELFINGQIAIGDGQTVELFDRNRTYLGLGYVLAAKLRIQLGWMNQKTVNWGKGQLQFSVHQSF